MSDTIELDEFLAQRIEVERELGRRSFRDFYLMAWNQMDPAPFVDGKHIRVVCYQLQQAARREVRRIAICIPPRYSKSLMSSVAFPAWVWTWWPSAKFITASYDLKLATRDALATRRLVQSHWYQQRWPEVQFMGDQNLKTFYQTTAGGQRFVCSPASGATGHGSDFNLFDDPHDITSSESDAERERARIFWFETMSGRFNNPESGVAIVIQQRVHDRDVAGECMRRGYYSVVLPARFEATHPQRHEFDWRQEEGAPLWPEKFTDDVLTGLWAELLDYAVAGQQQQRPRPRSGGLFKQEWFEVVDTLPAGIVWTRAWDLAGTEKKGFTSADPDWSVGCKFGKDPATGIYYIGNIVRLREDPGDVERAIKNTAQLDGRAVPIFIPQDPAQAGKFQAHYLTGQLDGYTVKTEPVTGDKVTRASPLASQAKAGNVKVYRALWNGDFFDEISAFPLGGHDDQVDAAAAGHAMFVSTTSGLFDFVRAQAEQLQRQEEQLRRSMGLPSVVR